MRSRIAITGIGVVSAFGAGRDAFWTNISQGVSGTRAITEFDASTYPCRVAAPVPPLADGLEPLPGEQGRADTARRSAALFAGRDVRRPRRARGLERRRPPLRRAPRRRDHRLAAAAASTSASSSTRTSSPTTAGTSRPTPSPSASAAWCRARSRSRSACTASATCSPPAAPVPPTRWATPACSCCSTSTTSCCRAAPTAACCRA